MKPAWDQLGDEFAGSKTVLIGDVDCTVEKDLCSKYGVRGYPTIKSFTGNPDGDPYEGGRDFAALKKFADESLGPSCSNDNIDLCDDEQKAIHAKQKLSDADFDKEISDVEAKLKKADTDLEELLSRSRLSTRLARRRRRILSRLSPRTRPPPLRQAREGLGQGGALSARRARFDDRRRAPAPRRGERTRPREGCALKTGVATMSLRGSEF